MATDTVMAPVHPGEILLEEGEERKLGPSTPQTLTTDRSHAQPTPMA
jgi:hypothetical protein